MQNALFISSERTLLVGVWLGLLFGIIDGQGLETADETAEGMALGVEVGSALGFEVGRRDVGICVEEAVGLNVDGVDGA